MLNPVFLLYSAGLSTISFLGICWGTRAAFERVGMDMARGKAAKYGLIAGVATAALAALLPLMAFVIAWLCGWSRWLALAILKRDVRPALLPLVLLAIALAGHIALALHQPPEVMGWPA